MPAKMKPALLALLPLAVASFAIALRAPDGTELAYSQAVYPTVARAFAFVNRVPFSLGEPVIVMVVAAVLGALYRHVRARRWLQTLSWSWCAAGVLSLCFLVVWGFNYARPTLAERSGIEPDDVSAEAVLSAGERAAELASKLFHTLEDDEAPTKLPMSFEEMNRELDRAFERLALPGDAIDFDPTPAKPLLSSTLFSYLGISGIFVPFTGEPSVNVAQPDAALPMVVAHEKAHQRGVPNEGEASFAGFLACADRSSPPYFRYSAYLFATRYLLGEASFYIPRKDVDAAWEHLGEGPREDVRAIREFWQRYEGPARTMASHANDSYLKAMQVEGGVQSYGTVVQLLMALDRRGELVRN